MSDDSRAVSLSEIEADLAKFRDGDARLSLPPAEWRPAPLAAEDTRGGTRPAAEPGRTLMARCPAETCLRFETLLHHEALHPSGGDYGILVKEACGILESEINRQINEPAWQHARRDLLAVLPARGSLAEAMHNWAASQRERVLGEHVNVLLTLRRGMEQRSRPLVQFLQQRFRPEFGTLLKDPRFIDCLSDIRRDYRNPGVHARKLFDVSEYCHFAQLVVGNSSFNSWDARGPEPASPTPSFAFLYHLLSNSLAPPQPQPAELAIARLLALRSPTPAFTVGVTVHPASATGLRDVIAAGPAGEQPFHLGDAIRFRIQADRDCHVMLLDVGTAGVVAVGWPNAYHTRTWVEGGQPHFLPDLEAPAFAYRLSGKPGTERVKVFATLQPVGVALLPEAGAALRRLTVPEIEVLADLIGRMPPSAWVAADCTFEIAP
jgi:hypothetical protein